eukprot:474422_1
MSVYCNWSHVSNWFSCCIDLMCASIDPTNNVSKSFWSYQFYAAEVSPQLLIIFTMALAKLDDLISKLDNPAQSSDPWRRIISDHTDSTLSQRTQTIFNLYEKVYGTKLNEKHLHQLPNTYFKVRKGTSGQIRIAHVSELQKQDQVVIAPTQLTPFKENVVGKQKQQIEFLQSQIVKLQKENERIKKQPMIANKQIAFDPSERIVDPQKAQLEYDSENDITSNAERATFK